jgi:hypothetical protein
LDGGGLMQVDRDDGGIQVMEHREPPRIGAGDRRPAAAVENATSDVRLRAFDPFRGRARVDPIRLAGTALVLLVVAAMLVYALSRATSGAVSWLHRQSQYRLAFSDIQLVRELPAWYRGGKREFLARVRRSSGNPEHVSLLETRPDRIATAFKLDPWVEEVTRVSFGPGRIAVDLKFREPVAWVKLQSSQQLVDGQGRLLPSEDVDVDLVGPVPQITGVQLTPPADTRAGVVWKSRSGSPDAERVDERIVGASGLASFLRERGRSERAAASKSLRMIEIIVTDFAARGLFAVNSEGTVFCWGSAPGAEGPKEPGAEEKWQILLRWEESPGKHTLPEEDYWEFTARGLEQRCPGSHHPRHTERKAAP